jgi:Glycoside-hydrolase family GH114
MSCTPLRSHRIFHGFSAGIWAALALSLATAACTAPSGDTAAGAGGKGTPADGGQAAAAGGNGSGGRAGAGGSADAAGGSSAATGGGSSVEVRLPPANAGFDYQIGEAYDPPDGVQIVSRDREASPAPGIYNICYVNGFQTQPQDNNAWLQDHPELVLMGENGDPVENSDWGEYLLDTSTADKRRALLEIELPWIQGCKEAGFDAIEVDNLDSYSRSGGLLEQTGNIEFMRLLSDAAHVWGLAVGQKNSAELLPKVDALGTDFAVVEECNRWNECGDFKAAYVGLVFIVEYREQDFAQGCSDFPDLSIVLRDLDVSGPGSSTYVYDGC